MRPGTSSSQAVSRPLRRGKQRSGSDLVRTRAGMMDPVLDPSDPASTSPTPGLKKRRGGEGVPTSPQVAMLADLIHQVQCRILIIKLYVFLVLARVVRVEINTTGTSLSWWRGVPYLPTGCHAGR
jgi:hypothetical protein